MTKAKECILYDVDTLEFIDFLCCLVHGQFLWVSEVFQNSMYYPSSFSFSLYPGSYTPPFKFSWAIHLTRGSNNFPRSLSSPPWYTLQNLFAKFNPTLLFESCVHFLIVQSFFGTFWSPQFFFFFWIAFWFSPPYSQSNGHSMYVFDNL